MGQTLSQAARTGTRRLPTLSRVTDPYQRDPALNASSAVAGTGAAK